MLTRQMLEAMPEGTIFATGVMLDNADGLFMTGSGKELRWVAVRGRIADWAIYCHFADKSVEWIRHLGDKVHDNRNILRCVTCDDTALACYRY